MFIGEQLVIKGPCYQVIQPNGRPFFLGRLLQRVQGFYGKGGKYTDIFQFENMPSFAEFPSGIHHCRYVPVFSVAVKKPPTCCCCWGFDDMEYKGPVYIQR